jgi:hypothetical protein
MRFGKSQFVPKIIKKQRFFEIAGNRQTNKK